MFNHMKIRSLDDVFLPLDAREPRGVYFYRINGYSQEIARFIRDYYEAARKSGVVVEGRVPNPDEKNLSYYNEIMGMDFQMDPSFLSASLKKWLPRMSDYQREQTACALYDTLDTLRRAGKTEHMLKNAYIKFMCWLYYKFERIVGQLGRQDVPKILYEGDVSNYELMLLTVLSNAGCDVLLLQYHGDAGYLKLDAGSCQSDALTLAGMTPFPEDFSLKQIRGEIQKEMENERLYGKRPNVQNCTNAWMNDGPAEILPYYKKTAAQRGTDKKLFYNCYCRIHGVADKTAYANELYQLYAELKNSGRQIVVVNERIPLPQTEEIASIRRHHYEKQEQMILDLSANITYTANVELQRVMVKAFVDVVRMEASAQGNSLNKLTNRAVYLLCWLKRYQGGLFQNWKPSDTGCFFYMGGCRDENEALFLRFLARIPVDVLILCPDNQKDCCLRDPLLLEVHYENALQLRTFPQENTDALIGTAAYHAEQELDTLLYQDSGVYRNRQYEKANAVILQTMYEEIKILWDQEVKYRPSFSTMERVVTIPVIFAKVSGVKDGQITSYWRCVRELITEDTFVIKSAPFIESTQPNPIKAYAAEFYKNGRLQRAKIKNHASYPYGFLREEIQDYILDKLQVLIDSKIIRGTFVNGTEYTITATLLNLPKDIVRLIQKFDFTKKNPKLIYINTGEEMISLEDTILTAFLNLVGFDVVFFVPTGYQNVEKYFDKKLIEEHQTGEYVYDLRVPNLESLSPNGRVKWRDKLFKRGR
ncbi:MAG: hypothetical protein HFH35_02620 [Eubacterium sp.]|nr:hypothetical protein [Eubacterium sp.]